VVEGERRKRSARLTEGSAALSAVLEPLSEMVAALSAKARLSIVTVRNDMFEVVASSGTDPLPVGTIFQSPAMDGFWRRLQDEGSFVFDDANLPEETRDTLGNFGMKAGFVASLYCIDDTAECVVIDEPGHCMDFGGTRRRLLDAAVRQAQVARENADLRSRAATRQRTLEAVARIGVAFTSVLDLKQTADQVVEYASLLLDIPAFVLLFRPEGAADFAVLAAEGQPTDLSRIYVKPVDLAPLDLQQRGALTAARLPQGDPGSLFALFEEAGLINVLVAPLVVEKDEVRGVLLAFDRRALELGEDELEAFHLLALQATNAIWNAERYEGEVHARRESKQELETASLLLEAADELNKWTNVEVLLQGLANITLRAVRHGRVSVGVLAEDRSHVTFAANVGEHAVDAGAIVPWDQLSSELRDVLTDGQTRIIEYAHLPEEERGLADRSKSRLALLVPLVFGDRILGHIAVDDPGRQHDFSDREAALVRGIAAQAAVALENARLFEAEQVRRNRAEVIHGVMDVAVSTLHVRTAAQLMLDYLVQRHDFDLASVWLANGDMLELVAAANYPSSYGHRYSPMSLSDSHDAPQVLKSGEPLIVPDAAAASQSVVDMYATIDVELGAYAIIPLRAGGRTTGILDLGWRLPRALGTDDVEFHSSIGHELGIVLENARLYETEHDIADRLQGALLAMPERIRGIDFAYSYHGATETARVGGDFYDIFELDQHHVGITIGDVAGKGLDAAVLTSLVKHTLRAHAGDNGKTPTQVLALTNDIVYKSTPTEAFATVFFAILDCRDGRMLYANAGHTTTVLVREEGSASGLPSTGPILGAFEGAQFEQHETCLGLDTLLFLYTDGLTEARRGSEQYGEDRVFERLACIRDASAARVVRSLMDDVVGFAGNRLRDDLAILAVRRLDPSAEAQAGLV